MNPFIKIAVTFALAIFLIPNTETAMIVAFCALPFTVPELGDNDKSDVRLPRP